MLETEKKKEGKMGQPSLARQISKHVVSPDRIGQPILTALMVNQNS